MTSTDDQKREFAEAEAKAQRLAQGIAAHLPLGIGFCLLLFTVGQKGYSTYVANVERADVVKLLRESADTLEAQRDLPPGQIQGRGDG